MALSFCNAKDTSIISLKYHGKRLKALISKKEKARLKALMIHACLVGMES
jgi:hypothetical protein